MGQNLLFFLFSDFRFHFWGSLRRFACLCIKGVCCLCSDLFEAFVVLWSLSLKTTGLLESFVFILK